MKFWPSVQRAKEEVYFNTSFDTGIFTMMFLHFSLFYRASTLSNAVSSLANTGISFTKVDEREKQAALEEEQARLRTLKVHNVTSNRLIFQALD